MHWLILLYQNIMIEVTGIHSCETNDNVLETVYQDRDKVTMD